MTRDGERVGAFLRRDREPIVESFGSDGTVHNVSVHQASLLVFATSRGLRLFRLRAMWLKTLRIYIWLGLPNDCWFTARDLHMALGLRTHKDLRMTLQPGIYIWLSGSKPVELRWTMCILTCDSLSLSGALNMYHHIHSYF